MQNSIPTSPESAQNVPSPSIRTDDPQEIAQIYGEGETVNVGYMSYAVWQSRWANRLSDSQFLNQDPDAMFLIVELTVRNDDTEPRMVPNFELIDDAGAIYETTSKAWMIDDAIGVLDSLNPNVQKTGLIVFDAPQKEGYMLKASGGFWSNDETSIKLSPTL